MVVRRRRRLAACVRVAVRQMSLAGSAPPWAGVGGQSRQLVDEITQFRDMTSLRTSYTIYPSCLGFANDAAGRLERFDVVMGLKTSNPRNPTGVTVDRPLATHYVSTHSFKTDGDSNIGEDNLANDAGWGTGHRRQHALANHFSCIVTGHFASFYPQRLVFASIVTTVMAMTTANSSDLLCVSQESC